MDHAARDHVRDTGLKGSLTGHHASNLPKIASRLSRRGHCLNAEGRVTVDDDLMAENISYGCDDGREILINILTNGGAFNCGSWKNIFCPGFTVCGVSAGYHKKHGNMCVVDFACGFEEAPESEMDWWCGELCGSPSKCDVLLPRIPRVPCTEDRRWQASPGGRGSNQHSPPSVLSDQFKAIVYGGKEDGRDDADGDLMSVLGKLPMLGNRRHQRQKSVQARPKSPLVEHAALDMHHLF